MASGDDVSDGVEDDVVLDDDGCYVGRSSQHSRNGSDVGQLPSQSGAHTATAGTAARNDYGSDHDDEQSQGSEGDPTFDSDIDLDLPES